MSCTSLTALFLRTGDATEGVTLTSRAAVEVVFMQRNGPVWGGLPYGAPLTEREEVHDAERNEHVSTVQTAHVDLHLMKKSICQKRVFF